VLEEFFRLGISHWVSLFSVDQTKLTTSAV
jgi:hypothetical protein